MNYRPDHIDISPQDWICLLLLESKSNSCSIIPTIGTSRTCGSLPQPEEEKNTCGSVDLFSPLGKLAGRAVYFTDVFSLFFYFLFF